MSYLQVLYGYISTFSIRTDVFLNKHKGVSSGGRQYQFLYLLLSHLVTFQQ